jgi:hypothetical protein
MASARDVKPKMRVNAGLQASSLPAGVAMKAPLRSSSKKRR